MEKAFETLLYATDGPVSSITLNRPERLNTIVSPMPDEIEAAVIRANRDPGVRVIVLRGAGRSFCAGFDFGDDFAAYADDLVRRGAVAGELHENEVVDRSGWRESRA